MNKKILIGVGIIAVLAIGWFVFNSVYSSSRDNQIVSALQSKAIPLVSKSGLTYFTDSACKQLHYNGIQVATPKGCAYVANVTDESKKNIPDFSASDQAVFNEVRQTLNEISSVKFVEIRPEYSPVDPSREIGIGFHIDCSFCRTRYVYWQGYKELPPNDEGQISYTPINENWYRVNEDWN